MVCLMEGLNWLMFLCCWIIISSFVYGDTSDIIFDLGGNDWKVSNSTMSPISATVPGDIYSDLMNNNIISHPYYGWNPMIDQWVAFSNWTYTKTFNLNNNDILNKRVLQLVCDGIDTRATIYINNKLIFTNDNMFQRNIINLANNNILKSTNNTIIMNFESKPEYALREGKSCNTSTAGQCPQGCPNKAQNADNFCDVNFIRTEPCSFSWDWGPAFAPVGIWKSIYLQGYDNAVIRDVVINSIPKNNSKIHNSKYISFSEQQNIKCKDFDNNECKDKLYYGYSTQKEWIKNAMNDRTDYLKDYTIWDTEVNVFLDAGFTDVLNPGKSISNNNNQQANTVNGTIRVYWNELEIEQTLNVVLNENEVNNFTVKMPTFSNITNWMPNGFGSQQLYNVTVNFEYNNEKDRGKEFKYGFRKVELVQNHIPGGKSFYFRVNGVPFPIHGSNWIPADSFESRVNRTSLEKLFIALRDSHQNMIRNWGGGIYQHDSFYDLADEYGIMIWEDMMWACNTYWVLPSYLLSSAKEVIDNVKRIQYHPCIAIWAGNNENGCTSGTNGAIYYTELYFTTILNNISSIDQTRPMVVSSPSNGNETANEPCSDSYSPYFGDLHSYLYGADCWNVSVYSRPRLMSEFGLQSWPAYPTLKNYFPQNQQNWTSGLMTNRNHHPSGQLEIENLVSMHYNTPNTGKTELDWEYWLYLSQMYQGYCYKVEVEYLRSIRYECSDNEPGCNMGSMYWQTNDIWPGASWAGIDYNGRYKAVQYYAQHFYDTLIVSCYNNNTHYVFHGINDDPNNSLENGDLELIIYSFNQSTAISSWHTEINIDKADAKKIYSISNNNFLSQSGCKTINDCILRWIVYDNNGNFKSTNWMFLGSPKNIISKDPILSILDVIKINDIEYHIIFNVENIAVFLWVETDINGYFDDNGGLYDSGTHILIFYSRVSTSEDEIKSTLTIKSLYDAGGFAKDSYL